MENIQISLLKIDLSAYTAAATAEIEKIMRLPRCPLPKSKERSCPLPFASWSPWRARRSICKKKRLANTLMIPSNENDSY
jgi:hypothetical protein